MKENIVRILRCNFFIHLRTLFIGLMGGVLFYKTNMPLPFMLGAIIANMIFAFLGTNVKVNPNLIKLNLVILGSFLGATFTPSIAEHVHLWFFSISLLGVFVLISVMTLYSFFTKVIKLDAKTAYFSSSPGGMTQMIFIGKDVGADDRIIALIHSVRVFMVVFIIPFIFKLFVDVEDLSADVIKTVNVNLAFNEYVILGLGAFWGVFVGKKLKFPAYFLTGAMLASICLYMSGICVGRAPKELMWCVQVIVGSSIGARFYGVSIKKYFPVIFSAIGSTSILMMLGFSFAYVVSHFTNLSFYPLILAYAPGGVADMCLISFALGLDVAFVSVHHIIRIIYIVSFMPFFLKSKLKELPVE
jgi:membrane AbrB-like protein